MPESSDAINHENAPKSMPQGARNIIRSNDSPSLWNLTLSPGWTRQESEALRLAVMKFGIGNWSKIVESQVLPYKTNAQLNLQLQRLLGQQSTAEFAGLHIDPKVIGEKNAKLQGPDIKRKNNCIVNTGNKLTREELRIKVLHNKEHYELPESEWSAIVLPKIKNPYLALVQKKEQLKQLQEELERVQDKIMEITESGLQSHLPSNQETRKTRGRATSKKATTKCKEAPKSAAASGSTDNDTSDDFAIARALQAQEEQECDNEYGPSYDGQQSGREDDKPSKRRRVPVSRTKKGQT